MNGEGGSDSDRSSGGGDSGDSGGDSGDSGGGGGGGGVGGGGGGGGGDHDGLSEGVSAGVSEGVSQGVSAGAPPAVPTPAYLQLLYRLGHLLEHKVSPHRDKGQHLALVEAAEIYTRCRARRKLLLGTAVNIYSDIRTPISASIN